MIIALSGAAGSGKDTIGDHLCSTRGFTRLKFATLLKDACALIFGLSHAQLYGNLREVVDARWGMTPREIMQKFGTDAMRDTFGDDIWVQGVRNILAAHPGTDYVITDCRFVNEAEMVRKLGGSVWRIHRPACYLPAPTGHISETALDGYKFDTIINNDGDLSTLLHKVEWQLRAPNGTFVGIGAQQ